MNNPIPFTDNHLKQFHLDGYVLIKNLFSKEETDLVFKTALNDSVISQKSYDRSDASGMRTKLALWYSLDESIYSQVARSARIVNPVERMLAGQVAHYHSKLMQKEPRVGGAWEWHQDYGYWYRNGFLFPDMLSVLTALTPANIENGCLQVIKGSHKMGRIEHGFAGEQIGADMEKVNVALSRMELVYVEMQPGDVLFFHCNILHRSEANLSAQPRWSMISAYNLVRNKPYKDEHVSSYTPIVISEYDSILETGAKGISENADFLIKSK